MVAISPAQNATLLQMENQLAFAQKLMAILGDGFYFDPLTGTQTSTTAQQQSAIVARLKTLLSTVSSEASTL